MSWLDPLLAIKTQQAGTTAGTRQTINFASGATVTDDPANDRVNVAITGSGITQLTGDVTAGPGSGSVAATVAKVNGVAVSGVPTAGQALVATSGTAASWSTVTPADASTSVKGIVQLAGDIAGTATSVTVAKVNGVSVSGTPASGQVIRATSGTASAWANVARGDITNTSGAVGDLITGNATTLTRLGIGSTGQVLTVSGGAPVWAAASPSLIWEADFTTGQTAQSWTAGSTYSVVGSSGTGNINFKHQGVTSGGVAATVTMVNASGLEIAYSNGVVSGSSICCALSQLNLGYFSGRPWRLWFYWTYSGTITAGNDNQQMFFDLDGTGATNPTSVPTNNLLWARTFDGAGSSITASIGFGTNVTTTGAVTQWFTSDVVCASFAPGNAAVSLGTYSAGWPAQASLLAYNGGPLVTSAYSVTAPYAHNAGLCFRFASSGAVNFNNRKIIIKAIRIEGL